jgi:adenosine/AMP kinase
MAIGFEILVEELEIPVNYNIILGQSHFIKTVEDLYEVMVNSMPNIQFGIAFNEASGPCLIRKDGTNTDLIEIAVSNLMKLGTCHSFLIVLKDAYPINVLPAIKDCREVVSIFCATANPVQVVVIQTSMGRGILGVIDGFSPKGIESFSDTTIRQNFLINIGYKR